MTSRIWLPSTVTTSYKPQATGYMPLFPRFPGRGGILPPRSGAHAGREAVVLLLQACKCWNVGEGLRPSPTGRKPEAGHGASTGHRPQAVSHEPSRHHHVPRTTYQQGGHTGPPLRRDSTRHESRTATTGHEPRATCRYFAVPTKRAFGSREPVQTGAVSVARRSS